MKKNRRILLTTQALKKLLNSFFMFCSWIFSPGRFLTWFCILGLFGIFFVHAWLMSWPGWRGPNCFFHMRIREVLFYSSSCKCLLRWQRHVILNISLSPSPWQHKDIPCSRSMWKLDECCIKNPKTEFPHLFCSSSYTSDEQLLRIRQNLKRRQVIHS